MKTLKTLKTLLLALLFTTTASAQLSITAYGDPVINIVGGDLNNYTEHNPVLSIGGRLEYVDDNKNMFVVTYEYTNLASKYRGGYVGFGRSYDFGWSKWKAYLDIGLISRDLVPVVYQDYKDTRSNPASITSALNGIISIKIYKRLSLDLHYALRLRTDIEGKLIGGNGDLGLRWEF